MKWLKDFPMHKSSFHLVNLEQWFFKHFCHGKEEEEEGDRAMDGDGEDEGEERKEKSLPLSWKFN